MMRLALQGTWVADNLKRLGSGAFYHLAYPTHQVDPKLLESLRHGTPKRGRIDIFVVREHKGVQVADGEVIAVHWYPEFIRIHFMIGRVYVDTLAEEIDWDDPDHLVIPRPR